MIRRKNQRGMSLVEVMISAGLIGGLALAVATIMKNIYKEGSTVESRFSEVEFYNQVKFILQDKNACKNTLQTKIFSGDTLTTIKDGSASPGITKYTTGTATTYMNGAVELTSINLSSVSGSAPASGTAMVTTKMTLNMKRLKPKDKQVVVVKEIYVAAAVNSTGAIQDCFVDADNAVNSACQNIGGTLVGYAPPCILIPFAATATTGGAPLSTSNAASTKFVYDFIYALDLPGVYVNVTGDTMTGDLTINSQLIVTGGATVAGNTIISGTLQAGNIRSTLSGTVNSFAGNITAPSMNVNDVAALGYGSNILTNGAVDTTVLNKGDTLRLLSANLNVTDKENIAQAILQGTSTTAANFNVIKQAVIDAADYGMVAEGPSSQVNPSSSTSISSCQGTRKVTGLYCTSAGCYVTCADDQVTSPSLTFTTDPSCNGAAGKAIYSVTVSGSGMAFSMVCTTISLADYLYGGRGAIFCPGTVVTAAAGPGAGQLVCKYAGSSCPPGSPAWVDYGASGLTTAYYGASAGVLSHNDGLSGCSSSCGEDRLHWNTSCPNNSVNTWNNVNDGQTQCGWGGRDPHTCSGAASIGAGDYTDTGATRVQSVCCTAPAIAADCPGTTVGCGNRCYCSCCRPGVPDHSICTNVNMVRQFIYCY